MTLIEAINCNRRNGTPGPWWSHYNDYVGQMQLMARRGSGGDLGGKLGLLVASTSWPSQDAGIPNNQRLHDLSRIAHIPDIENALLTACDKLRSIRAAAECGDADACLRLALEALKEFDEEADITAPADLLA